MIALGEAAAIAATASCSLAVTLVVREIARRRRLLDHPNERSSHAIPTPRLGGVGIVTAFLTVSGAWVTASGGPWQLALVLTATAVVALLGLVDDIRPLRARVRFAVQVIAATAVVLSSDGARGSPWLAAIPWPFQVVLLVLWMVWITNLYNFMDGIDGLAGGQAVIASIAIAVASLGGGAVTTAWLLLVLAAASAGFLVFNVPPASIFMGDVGSTAIGFFLAAAPLLPEAAPVPLEVVGLAISLFALDATTTLVRRAVRGERWFEAHRTHLYQRPIALGVGHMEVTLVAYAGMVLVALGAVAYPRASTAGRLLLLVAPVLIFTTLALVVGNLEKRQRSLAKEREPS